jgi:CHASE2 domain-containing sensor protein
MLTWVMEGGGVGGLTPTTHQHETLLSVMVCSVLILVYVWRRNAPRHPKVPIYWYLLHTACFLLYLSFIFYLHIRYKCQLLYFLSPFASFCLLLLVFAIQMHEFYFFKDSLSINGLFYVVCEVSTYSGNLTLKVILIKGALA